MHEKVVDWNIRVFKTSCHGEGDGSTGYREMVGGESPNIAAQPLCVDAAIRETGVTTNQTCFAIQAADGCIKILLLGGSDAKSWT